MNVISIFEPKWQFDENLPDDYLNTSKVNERNTGHKGHKPDKQTQSGARRAKPHEQMVCGNNQKNEAAVSRWCSNTIQPSLEMLVVIARVLNVDVRELLNTTK